MPLSRCGPLTSISSLWWVLPGPFGVKSQAAFVSRIPLAHLETHRIAQDDSIANDSILVRAGGAAAWDGAVLPGVHCEKICLQCPTCNVYYVLFRLHIFDCNMLDVLNVPALPTQVPVVQILLGQFGLVSSQQFLAQWRYVIVGATAAAAVLTPSTDPFTQTLLALPLIGLYLGGAGAVRLLEGTKAKA